MKNKNSIIFGAIAVVLVLIIGYWFLTNNNQTITATIEIDGSSTVFPITQAVAEEFQKINPDIRVNVGVSGTGGGFKRFQIGEIDINDASRPIKDSEVEECAKNGVEYIEFTIAIDGLAVMVNPENTWVDYLTVEELNIIWKPDSTVDTWNDIRPEWPDQEIHLYGPDTDSGTFDYFTDVINGDEGVSRADYTASADDNVLVQGIAGDTNSLGYFGYAYYAENTDKLKIIPIDSGSGPVIPSDQTVKAGQYTPLARPIFIYVNKASLENEAVHTFVTFYMENAEWLVTEVGYTPQPDSVYQNNLAEIE
jgi:phosphate transport system substrate-binding protein